MTRKRGQINGNGDKGIALAMPDASTGRHSPCCASVCKAKVPLRSKQQRTKVVRRMSVWAAPVWHLNTSIVSHSSRHFVSLFRRKVKNPSKNYSILIEFCSVLTLCSCFRLSLFIFLLRRVCVCALPNALQYYLVFPFVTALACA